MFSCGRCQAKVFEGPQCAKCKQHFDFPCSGVTEVGFRKLGPERKAAWKCTTCKGATSPAECPKIAASELEPVLVEIRKVWEKLTSFEALLQDMREVKSEINNLKVSVEYSHSELKDVKDKITCLEQKVMKIDEDAARIQCIEKSVLKLEQSINDKEQWSRQNNVEIKGIPVVKNENLLNVLSSLATKVQMPTLKDSVCFITRVQSRINDAPKPIIACFTNRFLKENFVAAIRNLKGLSAIDLGFDQNNKVFVNDHLTVFNKALLSKAKSSAKEHHFQFIWVKNCKIFARKNATSPILFIKTEEDLKKMG